MAPLPIESVVPELRRALAAGPSAVLVAPTGAGKTTYVPLALLNESWLAGRRLIMLEPRRLATRAAAHRMATLLGETVGETVGYRTRLDTKIGARTRIEVVTEGILSRLLQHDPSLAEYGLVIFDEFHERTLQADLGLALSLESQRLFRPDLRLLIMSATLDSAGVSTLMGQAPVVASEGRLFPVETRYLDRPDTSPVVQVTVATIRRVLTQEEGSLLVFLPGLAEIRRVEQRLQEVPLSPNVRVFPLHGDLPLEVQDQAIAPAPAGTRKVVLSSAVAETSLTIDGVRIVIDAGLMRVPRFDPRSGLTRLDTVRVTLDSAEQRRGRAGRLEPGLCYRLWTAAAHQGLTPRRRPEILDADLTPLLLDLAVWGAGTPGELRWLDPPPTGSTAQAKALLIRLGAIDESGRITAHGRRIAELALHPRLAHMMLAAVPMGLGGLACDVAALLNERDILRGPPGRRDADLRLRIEALRGRADRAGHITIDRGIADRARRSAQQWRRHLKSPPDHRGEIDRLGILLAFAYPDRIAQRQPGADRRYRLANGRGACFSEPDALAAEEYLVIADLEGDAQWARIFLAAPVALRDLELHHVGQVATVEVIEWDERSQAVSARRRRQLGALTLEDQVMADADPARVAAAMLTGVRRAGLGCLPWARELGQWRARVTFLRRLDGASSTWPDVSDQALMDGLDRWLGPYLNGVTRLDQLKRLDLSAPLDGLLTPDQRRNLDRLAPTHLAVPTGSRIRVDYEGAPQPILPVRLQEMFGCRETPRVAGGKVPVTLHLLSPAGRPVQVTQDLAGFWSSSYFDIRKELRGRYPKHHWPEDPLSAAPTRRTKRSPRSK